MAAAQWGKTRTLIEQINESFAEFDFFQLVYLLNVLSQQDNTLSTESQNFLIQKQLKFFSQTDLNYKPNAVINLMETARGHNLEINFIGLVGPAGIMPPHYTTDLLENDPENALYDFLNIFNHRLISMYYLAWQKYRLHLLHQHDLSDDLSLLLKHFIGLLPTSQQTAPLTLDLHHNLLYFGGFNAKSVKTAEGLERLLQYYFSVPITIQPFNGSWVALGRDNCSMLPSAASPAGQFNRLSKDCVIGQRVWHSQNRFCVVMRILNNEQFAKLLANRNVIVQMEQLIKLYLGEAYTYFVKVMLAPEIKVHCQLSKTAAPILAWNCWCDTNKQMAREFILPSLKVA